MKQSEMTPSRWPRSIYNPDTGEMRLVSRQRVYQLLNPESERLRDQRRNKTLKRKAYKAAWWQKNKHRFTKGRRNATD